MRFLALLLGLAGAGAIYQLLGARRDRRTAAPPGLFLDVGGHHLHLVCRGEGGPVAILDAGIAASSLSWSKVQPGIAAFTRVCAYDRAGLGWSDAPSCATSFAQVVDELGRVVDHVSGGARAVLVGHSFGSLILRAYAARHPERVAALVLVDPPTEWLTMTASRARLLRGGRYLAKVGAILARIGVVRACLALLTGGAPGAPRRFVRVFGRTTATTLERLVGEVRKLPSEVYPLVQAAWCRPKCFNAMAAHLLALERDVAEIASAAPPRHIPVAVISSGNQPAEHIRAQQALAASSDAGEHVVAARSGHWILFDEPEVVVAVARAIVTSLRTGAGRELSPGHDARLN